ncbi:malto-oligosyltrehalose synthase [Leifsonia shinshuensis]|uniref:malto-oligosyltrehalose synthase n=1 Tax=Leifsonia shinshuensis TaxID=150026 RepID=UPI001F514DF6|nr:malto-oligosyltrehalose synthase [Leifsonia shinshuensis]MCI0157922.1 malto-oligosyltrehalose synthase [Leifsonia shinshuensis]
MSNDVPTSTYRLQITPDFTLRDAAQTLDYLHRLGVGAVYLSPLLQAASGSAHGYDVVDPTRVDASRGGPEALREFSDAAHARGLDVIVDIVPNHLGVAVPHENPWWWDVLRLGRDSAYAGFFDIDWEFGGGRLRIPVLGDGPDELSALRVEGAELRYHEHRFPLAPGTELGAAPAVHDRQHYELISWRRADAELNYRRFFAVNTLAGVRVEDPQVFDATHAEIGRWLREGLVDGLRVDHPDGLRDPGDYLVRLAALAGTRPVWVEKILEGDERIPEWPIAGTTGYDALGVVDRVFVDPAGEEPLTALAEEHDGREESRDWAGLVHRRKRAVADGILRSEVLRVAREVGAGAPGGDDEVGVDDVGVDDVADAVAELAAAFPVYRSYLPFGADHLAAAHETAAAGRPDLAETLAHVVDRFVPDGEGRLSSASARFQQTSGAVMAKGVEDNAFYRYTRLTSLTEVGGDPSEFALSVADFHRLQQQRLTGLPRSLTALSTHDTKRSEDTRARIAVLAEIPERWARFLGAVRTRVGLGDGTLENLLWQSIVGAWPASRERLHAYALKAAREAGASTGWSDPDPLFEGALADLVDAAFDDARVAAEVEAIAAVVAAPGASNGLGAKLLQLLAPGVPDVYQGSERWERSLVDPDNRRPVEFDAAAGLLAHLDEGRLPAIDSSGAAKLLVTSRALRLRRDRPELFTGYRPVLADGPRSDHLVAFDRGGAFALATRLPVGLAGEGGWGDTVLDVGSSALRDELTGRTVSGRVQVEQLFDRYPVALLAVTR